MDITVSQGLGYFVMDPDGHMRAELRPPGTRKIGVTFEDGNRIEMDADPAFADNARGFYHTVISRFNRDGYEITAPQVIADFPMRTILRHVVSRLMHPEIAPLPGISAAASLERAEAIHVLAENTKVIRDHRSEL